MLGQQQFVLQTIVCIVVLVVITEQSRPARTVSLVRWRRQTAGDDESVEEEPFICCGTDMNVPEDEFKLDAECRQKVPVPEPKTDADNGTHVLIEEACTYECVAKQREGLYNDDGSVNKEVFLRYESANFHKDDDYEFHVDQLTRFYDTCTTRVAAEARRYADQVPCDLHYYGLENCIYREMELQCPDTKRNKSKLCDEIRESLEQVENVFY